jgi:hypothetical protein
MEHRCLIRLFDVQSEVRELATARCRVSLSELKTYRLISETPDVVATLSIQFTK